MRADGRTEGPGFETAGELLDVCLDAATRGDIPALRSLLHPEVQARTPAGVRFTGADVVGTWLGEALRAPGPRLTPLARQEQGDIAVLIARWDAGTSPHATEYTVALTLRDGRLGRIIRAGRSPRHCRHRYRRWCRSPAPRSRPG